MNEPTEYRDPLQWPGTLNINKLSPEKRLEIDGIRRAEDDIAGGFIKLGGHLCRLKELCEHGEFEALAAMYCRLGATQRQNAMKVFREYGQNPTAVGFSAIALIELTRADDPQAALAEAAERKEAGEEVTAKVAKEIAAAQKAKEEAEAKVQAIQLRLDEMEAQTKPDQSRLIRELALMRKGGGISEGAAQAYSLLPEYLQRNILETLRERDRAQVDRQTAERNAAQAVANQQQAMAEAQQAKAERDEANRRAEEVARDGAQGVIDELRADVETLKKQMARERETAWEEGKKAGLTERNEELEAKVAAAEKERMKLRRELTSAEGALRSAHMGNRILEARARGAEEQLEGASPVGKDAIHAKTLAHMTEDLKATIAKLEGDCDRHQRKLSDAAMRALLETANGYFAGQETLEVAYEPVWTTVDEAMRNEGLEE